MKNITKILLLITITVLFTAASCQKDENGNRITYYNKKTGEGYVFYKFKNDSIAPIENAIIKIESYTLGMFSIITRHSDYVYTDNSGKYSFKFVKKINEKKVEGYWVSVKGFPFSNDTPIFTTGNTHYNNNILNKSNKIFIDTLFCEQIGKY